ncbi:D-cysteine desulfhydrase family protein [Dehalococcoidia bacterium]|nr:D-cysteine desulfhydrase family protein [Dehalococcoidia bacterium]
MQIGKLPRVRLAALPTPLEEMGNLSKKLGGPRLFIKRDDNTGLAFGGNKARKLEFLMGDALDKGVDTIITAGGIQSNHARMTAAAANRLGFKVVLVLSGEKPSSYKANLLLDHLLQAEIRFLNTKDSEQIKQRIEEIAAELSSSGHNTYIIPPGGSNRIGVSGYALAMSELLAQANEKGVKFDSIVLACGGGGTQAGVVVGTKALNLNMMTIGISVSREAILLKERVASLANETAEHLGLSMPFTPAEIEVYDEYVGEGYAIPTTEGIEAIKLVAGLEGIFLDPVYTGKAMAGLISLIKTGRFRSDENVVFLHTGGIPAIFTDESIWF